MLFEFFKVEIKWKISNIESWNHFPTSTFNIRCSLFKLRKSSYKEASRQ